MSNITTHKKEGTKAKGTTVHSIELAAAYEPKDSAPKVTRTKNKYVEYGDNNDFAEYLEQLSESSPTHGALCQRISQLIHGTGLNGVEFMQVGADDAFQEGCAEYWVQGGFYLEIIDKVGGGVSSVNHVPFKYLRPNEEEDGEVTSYTYCEDWGNTRKAVKVNALGYTNEGVVEGRSILFVGRRKGKYFPKPVYIGAINWIEIENEIGKYHIGHLRNGLHAGFFIIAEQGQKDEEQLKKEAKALTQKMMGTGNAGKFAMINYETGSTPPQITPAEVSDADKQYEFQSSQSTSKIMLGHGVVSGIMFGIDKATGFGNNAEELETAAMLFDFQVVIPHRNIILKSMRPLFAMLGSTPTITSNNPFLTPKEEVKEEKKEELSEVSVLDEFIGLGEELNDDWELIDERDVDYDEEDYLDTQVVQWNLKAVELASTGTSKPSAKSEQDEEIDGTNYRVRYEYVGSGNPQREFCRKMMAAKKIYRKEDILRMTDKPVNAGWGAKGADTYSIWLYKGGGSCHHKWKRKTYAKKGSNKVEVLSTAEARRRGFNPVNEREVSMMPKDMKNKGFLEPR